MYTIFACQFGQRCFKIRQEESIVYALGIHEIELKRLILKFTMLLRLFETSHLYLSLISGGISLRTIVWVRTKEAERFNDGKRRVKNIKDKIKLLSKGCLLIGLISLIKLLNSFMIGVFNREFTFVLWSAFIFRILAFVDINYWRNLNAHIFEIESLYNCNSNVIAMQLRQPRRAWYFDVKSLRVSSVRINNNFTFAVFNRHSFPAQ